MQLVPRLAILKLAIATEEIEIVEVAATIIITISIILIMTGVSTSKA